MSDTVMQALEEQVGHYRRLAKLAELQHVHVQHNQLDALMSVLRQRESLWEQISRLEVVIGPPRRDWQVQSLQFDAESRSRAESLFGEIRLLMDQIVRLDQNDTLVIQQRKLNVRRQISQADSARQVNRTYAKAAYGARQSRMNITR